MTITRPKPETEETETQTKLQCYPFIISETEQASVQTDQETQTIVHIHPRELNSDTYDRLIHVTDAELLKNYISVIIVPKKSKPKLQFITPSSQNSISSQSVQSINDSLHTAKSDEYYLADELLINEENKSAEEVDKQDEENKAKQKTDQEQGQTNIKTEESTPSTTEENKSEKSQDRIESTEDLEEKRLSSDNLKKLKPSKIPRRKTSSEINISDTMTDNNENDNTSNITQEIKETSGFDLEAEKKKGVLKRSIISAAVDPDVDLTLLPEEPGVPFLFKGKEKVFQEVQTDLSVKPHIIDSNEEATVVVDITTQTSVTGMTNSKTLLPDLKKYHTHVGQELQPRVYEEAPENNEDVMEIIVSLIDQAEEEHFKIFNLSSSPKKSKDIDFSGSCVDETYNDESSKAEKGSSDVGEGRGDDLGDVEVDLPEIVSKASRTSITNICNCGEVCMCAEILYAESICSCTPSDMCSNCKCHAKISIGSGCLCRLGKNDDCKCLPDKKQEPAICPCIVDRKAECICPDRYALSEEVCPCTVDRKVECKCKERYKPYVRVPEGVCPCILDRNAECICNRTCATTTDGICKRDICVCGKKKPMSEKGEHGINCICIRCRCGDSEHPPGCDCVICTCKGFEYYKKKVDIHPKDCKCKICLCAVAAEKTEGKVCHCSACQCEVCVEKKRKTIICTCRPTEVCENCIGIKRNAQNLQICDCTPTCVCANCFGLKSKDPKPKSKCECIPKCTCEECPKIKLSDKSECDCSPTCQCADCLKKKQKENLECTCIIPCQCEKCLKIKPEIESTCECSPTCKCKDCAKMKKEKPCECPDECECEYTKITPENKVQRKLNNDDVEETTEYICHCGETCQCEKCSAKDHKAELSNKIICHCSPKCTCVNCMAKGDEEKTLGDAKKTEFICDCSPICKCYSCAKKRISQTEESKTKDKQKDDQCLCTPTCKCSSCNSKDSSNKGNAEICSCTPTCSCEKCKKMNDKCDDKGPEEKDQQKTDGCQCAPTCKCTSCNRSASTNENEGVACSCCPVCLCEKCNKIQKKDDDKGPTGQTPEACDCSDVCKCDVKMASVLPTCDCPPEECICENIEKEKNETTQEAAMLVQCEIQQNGTLTEYPQCGCEICRNFVRNSREGGMKNVKNIYNVSVTTPVVIEAFQTISKKQLVSLPANTVNYGACKCAICQCVNCNRENCNLNQIRATYKYQTIEKQCNPEVIHKGNENDRCGCSICNCIFCEGDCNKRLIQQNSETNDENECKLKSKSFNCTDNIIFSPERKEKSVSEINLNNLKKQHEKEPDIKNLVCKSLEKYDQKVIPKTKLPTCDCEICKCEDFCENSKCKHARADKEVQKNYMPVLFDVKPSEIIKNDLNNDFQVGEDHPINCKCVLCIAEALLNHPPDCCCIACSCEKLSEHPPNCKCSICKCAGKQNPTEKSESVVTIPLSVCPCKEEEIDSSVNIFVDYISETVKHQLEKTVKRKILTKEKFTVSIKMSLECPCHQKKIINIPAKSVRKETHLKQNQNNPLICAFTKLISKDVTSTMRKYNFNISDDQLYDNIDYLVKPVQPDKNLKNHSYENINVIRSENASTHFQNSISKIAIKHNICPDAIEKQLLKTKMMSSTECSDSIDINIFDNVQRNIAINISNIEEKKNNLIIPISLKLFPLSVTSSLASFNSMNSSSSFEKAKKYVKENFIECKQNKFQNFEELVVATESLQSFEDTEYETCDDGIKSTRSNISELPVREGEDYYSKRKVSIDKDRRETYTIKEFVSDKEPSEFYTTREPLSDREPSEFYTSREYDVSEIDFKILSSSTSGSSTPICSSPASPRFDTADVESVYSVPGEIPDKILNTNSSRASKSGSVKDRPYSQFDLNKHYKDYSHPSFEGFASRYSCNCESGILQDMHAITEDKFNTNLNTFQEDSTEDRRCYCSKCKCNANRHLDFYTINSNMSMQSPQCSAMIRHSVRDNTSSCRSVCYSKPLSTISGKKSFESFHLEEKPPTPKSYYSAKYSTYSTKMRTPTLHSPVLDIMEKHQYLFEPGVLKKSLLKEKSTCITPKSWFDNLSKSSYIPYYARLPSQTVKTTSTSIPNFYEKLTPVMVQTDLSSIYRSRAKHTRSVNSVTKQDPVLNAMLACEAELKPIKEALNDVQTKLKNLNMPELDCILKKPAGIYKGINYIQSNLELPSYYWQYPITARKTPSTSTGDISTSVYKTTPGYYNLNFEHDNLVSPRYSFSTPRYSERCVKTPESISSEKTRSSIHPLGGTPSYYKRHYPRANSTKSGKSYKKPPYDPNYSNCSVFSETSYKLNKSSKRNAHNKDFVRSYHHSPSNSSRDSSSEDIPCLNQNRKCRTSSISSTTTTDTEETKISHSAACNSNECPLIDILKSIVSSDRIRSNKYATSYDLSGTKGFENMNVKVKIKPNNRSKRRK